MILYKDMSHKQRNNRKNPAIVAFVLVAVVIFVSYGFVPADGKYHGSISGSVLRSGILTTSVGQYFTGSGNCVACHDTDPNGLALVDASGVDVSPVNDWRATLMANSAKDPFWKAKVKHEVLSLPLHQDVIENTCTGCHAPQGNNEFHMTNAGDFYSMQMLAGDALGQDGVGCMGCHGIEDPQGEVAENGQQLYSANQVAYGNFPNPWSGPMIAQTGFSPVYSAHMGESELCAGCHSLFTQTHDYNQQQIGSTFFEQSTYHEWLNSVYDEQGTECQSCHMPAVEGGAIISPTPTWLFPQPFKKHYFVGGNATMLKLMKDNIEELDISASEANYDMVIQRTIEQLQLQSMDASFVFSGLEQDSAVFDLRITNLAGHKFPSGYPSRLLTVEMVVADEFGNEVFRSGGMDENNNIIGRDADYEPHYDVIRNEDEVQIYEMVMADVNDQPTTVLEHAYYPLKDNRLVPLGYSSSHFTGDTTKIAGLVLNDDNFNRLDGAEGSGSDDLQYRIARPSIDGAYTATVRVFYQSLPPKWMEDMFALDADEINTFKAMFEAADQSPVLVWEGTADFVNDVAETAASTIKVGPNPCLNGKVSISGLRNRGEVRVFDGQGKVVAVERISNSGEILLPTTKGVYYLEIKDGMKIKVEKILRL
jgi:hypothetical protein